jgi:hypothetical protein
MKLVLIVISDNRIKDNLLKDMYFINIEAKVYGFRKRIIGELKKSIENLFISICSVEILIFVLIVLD